MTMIDNARRQHKRVDDAERDVRGIMGSAFPRSQIVENCWVRLKVFISTTNKKYIWEIIIILSLTFIIIIY